MWKGSGYLCVIMPYGAAIIKKYPRKMTNEQKNPLYNPQRCDILWKKEKEAAVTVERICCIVGACAPGEIHLPPGGDALVIAADGGLRYLEERGITPELVVGDFDSLGHVPEGENILTHPVEKDDTDTMLAVKLGLERGCRTFLMYGCLGGRPDHTYANYQTLSFLAAHKARGYLVGNGWVISAVCGGTLVFPKGLSGTVSVFCPDGEARGVTLKGLYYPLEDGTLTSGFPLGVSNHFTGVSAEVSVADGSLLVMWEEPAEKFAERI